MLVVDGDGGLRGIKIALLGEPHAKAGSHAAADMPEAPVMEDRFVELIIAKLYEAYRASGATLAEINPMIVNPAGEVKAIDAKMNIDDNALMRLPDHRYV